MSAGLKIRKEEYTALGDFIRVSFVKNQAEITSRFPKFNAAFLTEFTAKLNEVKTLESGLVLTEQQKATTAALYTEAAALNKELNFLISYIKTAGLDASSVSDLKKDLSKNNIEGAVLKLESVKQFVVSNLAALVTEGLAAGFVAAMEAHKVSLAEKNTLQNSVMNNHKTLTADNKEKYAALYDYITKIAKAGKLIFDGTITEEEYNLSKTLAKMRSPGRTSASPAPAPVV